MLLYEAPHVARRSTELRRLWQAPREALRAWLSTEHTLHLLESELDRAIGTLHHKAQGFEVQLSDLGLSRLAKEDAFRFFRELVNYDPAVVDAARLTHDTHLDYFVSDSAVDCHRDHLMVGDRLVKVLSMKEPPSQTFAFLLQDLYEIPGEFVACLEWQRIPNDRMRRDLQSRRRHFFNKRVSIVNYVSPETRAGGDAGRRLREHDGSPARGRAHGAGGPRPLLRQLLADARPARDRRAGTRSSRRPKR